MTEGYPKLLRTTVRDSYDDDDPSDIDDEVFIRDGKNGILKGNDDCGLKRPLMAPRKRPKINTFPESPPQVPYKTLYAPFCYTLLGFAVLLALITLCIVIIFEFPTPLEEVKDWLSLHSGKFKENRKLDPCVNLSKKVVWVKTFPKFTSEAPLKSIDVNGDNIEDIVVGFSTGLDKVDTPEYICNLYFNREPPCLGGVMVVNGRNGSIIWTHWTTHAVFSVDCSLDISGDNIKDCIIAGRGGLLKAIDGRDGSSRWDFKDSSAYVQTIYNVCDARYIADIDNDGVGDLMVSYTWQSGPENFQSDLILLSGKTGTKMQSLDLSTKEELFVAPETLVHPDGETFFLLAASDEKKSGGLYILPRSNLLKGDFKLRPIYHGNGKGVSLSPILVDITLDGTEDIIVACYNSTIIALDGLSFKVLWNFTLPGAVVISMPIPGYYNDDAIPDFMIRHQIGPGYPVYYYTSTTILDGKDGNPILNLPIIDTMSAQISGLSITANDFGNDWFLYWSADCLNHKGATDRFEFLKAPSVDANLCKLRFNSSLVTTLYALSQHINPPGIPLYNSENWREIEFNSSLDSYRVADDFVISQMDNNRREGFLNRSPNLYENVNEKSDKDDEYYSRNNPFENSEKQHENFLDEALDELNQNNNAENINEPVEEVYDEDDGNNDEEFDRERQRMLASRPLSEVRLQRSEEHSRRRINNDTNDFPNKLDLGLDYTNGQSKHNSYYSGSNNKSNNNEDGSDYMNVPDIDFVDNLKEAEVLGNKKKREARRPSGKSFRDKLRKYSKEDSAYRRISKFLKNRIKRKNSIRQTDSNPNKNFGLQRQSPTGILLPSLNQTRNRVSVDLVFSTYWLPASNIPFVLLPSDLDCIEDTLSKIHHDIFLQQKTEIINKCISNRNLDYQMYDDAMDRENTKIALGQMTLYRMKLTCNCADKSEMQEQCKDISKKQSWSSYLGNSGSGYFTPLT